MVQNNFKESFMELIKGNKINGRITTFPFDDNEAVKVGLSFNDIYYHDNIAMFWDDPQEDRAETAGCFRLDLSEIKDVHYMDDPLKHEGLYGEYDVLLYIGENMDKQILITFNMNDKNQTPFIIDMDDVEEERLCFAYATESVHELDYFLGKPVKINLSGLSYQSRYDADNDNYSLPIVASVEVKTFCYEYKNIYGIPCITITDHANENTKIVLNAIGYIHRCNDLNSMPDDKRIYHVTSELVLASIMDIDYKYPTESEVA